MIFNIIGHKHIMKLNNIENYTHKFKSKKKF